MSLDGVVVDDSGRAHIALRRGDKVVSLNLVDGSVIDRRVACGSPRGIDFDDASGLLYVACHSGSVVTLDPAGGPVIDRFDIEAGLRDVVVTSQHIYVSKFRTADLFVLDRQGTLLTTMRPPGIETITFDERDGEVPARFEPAVAWRTIRDPNGGVVMIHQRGKDDDVKPSGGGYGGDPCQGGVVHSVVTPMQFGVAPPASTSLGFMTLPVDATLIDNGQNAVVVAAGNGGSNEIFAPPVMDVPVHTIQQDFDCFFGQEWGIWEGQVTAAVSTANDTVALQIREPAQLQIFMPAERFDPVIIELGGPSVKDTGHQLFHLNTGASVSCASCHPEGADDGRVWKFECIGERRTQPLHFGILGTEPFHWDGDMQSFDHLMSEVFVGRMSGGQPETDQVEAMAEWLDTVKAPTRGEPDDAIAVERGRALYNSPEVGCATCHSGPKLISTGLVQRRHRR